MKEKLTGKVSVKSSGAALKNFGSRSNKAIRHAIAADPEAHSTDVNFWKTAKLVLPHAKQTVTIRLDADLIGWLRQKKGYQTRINAVLRTYMEAQKT